MEDEWPAALAEEQKESLSSPAEEHDGVELWQLSRKQRREVGRQLPVDLVLEFLRSGSDGGHGFRLRGQWFSFSEWGECLSHEQRETVFLALQEETRPSRLGRLLAVFSRAPMPRVTPFVLSLVDHRDRYVRHRAVWALKQHRHADIRELAIRKLLSGARICHELLLWVRNYRPGDIVWLRRALRSDQNNWKLHNTVSDLLAVAKANPGLEMAEVLLFLYEESPCLNCRESAVGELEKLGALPDWVREELPFGAQAFRYRTCFGDKR